jgi:hypothetical protein
MCRHSSVGASAAQTLQVCRGPSQWCRMSLWSMHAGEDWWFCLCLACHSVSPSALCKVHMCSGMAATSAWSVPGRCSAADLQLCYRLAGTVCLVEHGFAAPESAAVRWLQPPIGDAAPVRLSGTCTRCTRCTADFQRSISSSSNICLCTGCCCSAAVGMADPLCTCWCTDVPNVSRSSSQVLVWVAL